MQSAALLQQLQQQKGWMGDPAVSAGMLRQQQQGDSKSFWLWQAMHLCVLPQMHHQHLLPLQLHPQLEWQAQQSTNCWEVQQGRQLLLLVMLRLRTTCCFCLC
jgi:hypothetical protein